MQNGSLPEGLQWHRRLRAHGWSNALFNHAGASASIEGTPMSAGAHISVDTSQNEVMFTFPAAALGRLASLSGARVWLNTWDYDGGYRALGSVAQAFSMGGAPAYSAQAAPKTMDSSAVITLP